MRMRRLFIGLCCLFFLLPLHAGAESFDANALRLQGARSLGGVLLPSARVLPAESWDLSLTFAHEGRGVGVEVGTGEVRGRNLSREVDWLASRNLLHLQLAVSPLTDLELGFGIPLLLGQSVTTDGSLEPPQSGSSALGDARVGLRYAFLRPSGSGLAANLQAAVLLPTGDEAYAMGEGRVRADLGMTLGYESGADWSLDLHLGHQMGEAHSLENQLFGDSLFAGLGFRMQHAVREQDRLQWSLEAVSRHAVAGAPAGLSPERSALEFLGGGRYFHGAFYADLGAGVAALDAGPTPAWRVLVSLGTTGSWSDRAAETRRRDQVEQALRAEIAALQSQNRTASTCCAALEEREAISGLRAEFAAERRALEGKLQAQELERQAIFFETGSAELDAVARQSVRQVVLLLSRVEGKVQISGYADDRGTRELNKELSQRRAEAVRDALVAAGIPEERLLLEAKGDDDPLAPTTEFGRSLNRRVSFRWLP